VNNVAVTDVLPNIGGVTYVTGSASNGGSYNNSTNSLSWNGLTLGPGATLTLTYQLQVQLLAAKFSPLVNTATLSYPGGATTASNSVTVIGGYLVHVAVYNEAGELVQSWPVFNLSYPIVGFDLSQATLSTDNGVVNLIYKGSVLEAWDGTTSKGVKVTNGTYYVKVSSTDPYGVTSSVTHVVTVQIARSTLEVAVYNEAGEVVKTFTQAELQTLLGSSLLPADYNVGQAKSGPGLITPSYSNPTSYGNYLTITLGSGRSFNWDGRGDDGRILTGGRYFIEIKSNMANGTQQEIITAITIQDSGSSAITGVLLEPNVINTNQVPSANFVVGTGMAQVDGVKIKIYTVAGELVPNMSFSPAVVNPGNVTVTWNLGQSNLASGTYLAVIELQSNGAMVGRQIIKAVVLH
jgi:flagellar hook assembly protein FlgD